MIDIKHKYFFSELWLKVVQHDGSALEHVKELTEEISCYLGAVKRNGYALQYVKGQTLEICLQLNEMVLRYNM